MEKEILGKTLDGEEIFAYTLTNSNGMKAKIMNYGCNLLELWVPDKDGNLSDVVLGYEKLEDYFVNAPGFGCCITPNGNRIANAKFILNGTEYKLDVNDGPNNLHSGNNPMHRRNWELVSVDNQHITFKAHKADGDMGMPSELDIVIKYTLSDDNAIRIDYEGSADNDAIFNPTNHSYFNLAGHNTGDILNEIVWLDADKFTITDDKLIPTGETPSVVGTPLDFTSPKALREGIDDISYEPIKIAGGFDHNFVLNAPSLDKPCGYLEDTAVGRKMEIYTTLPGMQLYSGNFIGDNEIGKGNFKYEKRYGVCFESQYFPNAINISSFDQPVVKGGEKASSTTIYKFV